MGIEFEVRIECYSQYTGSPFQGQYGDVQSDLRMGARLHKMRGEQSDSGFWKRKWANPTHLSCRVGLNCNHCLSLTK